MVNRIEDYYFRKLIDVIDLLSGLRHLGSNQHLLVLILIHTTHDDYELITTPYTRISSA